MRVSLTLSDLGVEQISKGTVLRGLGAVTSYAPNTPDAGVLDTGTQSLFYASGMQPKP
jgi:hypothetical protein